MSKFVKILIGLALGFILLVLCAVGVGVYWWSTRGREYIESAKQSVKEGIQFGANTNAPGCVREALSRHKRNSGFTAVIENRLFLTGCLKAAEPVEGFCDAVPRQTEFVKSSEWQVAQCRGNGISDSLCPQMFTEVQKYCDVNDLRTGTNPQ